ncbi:hypothetical protein [uncultured Roseobacter sp.]|uniref:hypothetical protein n=1 Tax=uncultured Roseobacter sp. TaxID=114847 RepID=UPI0026116AC1|nr:hypothetical protein [uncultured Roseobacter sp.]
MLARDVKPDHLGRVRKEVPILQLVEWAFRTELASIEFDELAQSSGGHRPSFGTEYLLLQRHNLGCKVDGGGRSEPHPDADLVASALGALPVGHGGRKVALWVAELARAGMRPDWREAAKPQCVPLDLKRTKHGMFAKTESLGSLVYVSRGRSRTIDVRWCPVVHRNSVVDLARRRRAYLQWWSALKELRDTFRIHANLSAYVVSDRLPDRTPWKKGVDENLISLT